MSKVKNEECVDLKEYGVWDAVFSEGGRLEAISFVDGNLC